MTRNVWVSVLLRKIYAGKKRQTVLGILNGVIGEISEQPETIELITSFLRM